MKNFLCFMCLLLMVAACKDSGSSNPAANSAKKTPPVNPAGGSSSNDEAREDLGILQGMVNKETTISQTFLDKAEKLNYINYGVGRTITLQECEAINAKATTNYKLVRHEVYTDKGVESKEGLNLCLNSSIKFGQYIVVDSAKSFFKSAPVVNSLGVPGASVLTLKFNSMSDNFFEHEWQFVFDKNFKIIEATFHVENSMDRIMYNDVSSLSPEGHVLGRVEKARSNMNEEYLWKGASTFVSSDGSVSMAMRVYQNDGKGTPMVATRYTIPYNLRWEKYEATPLNRMAGYYQIDNQITSSPHSVIALHFVSKNGSQCGDGHIGYNASGGSLREFGDIKCGEKMDAQTMRR